MSNLDLKKRGSQKRISVLFPKKKNFFKGQKYSDTKIQKQSCNDTIKKQIQSIDIYGQQINLTYEGDDTFKTLPGAFSTLFVMILLLAYSAFRTYVMITKNDNTLSQPQFMLDLTQEPEYFPGEIGFDIAFGIKGNLDPKYGYYQINQVYSFYTAGNTTRGKIKIPLQFQQCNSSLFNYQDQSQVQLYGVNTYQCLVNKNFSVWGDYYASDFKYLEIKLIRCRNQTSGNTCASYNDIRNYFENVNFNVAFVNTYFDFNDYVTPVKSFIDDSLFWQIEIERNKQANFYVQQQQAQLQDQWLQLGQQDSLTFPSVNNQRTYDAAYSDSDGIMISLFIRYDARYSIYNRQIYSILSLFGDIGGLQSSLFTIGFYFISFLSNRIFVSSILKQIYQVKNDFKLDSNDEDKESQEDEDEEDDNDDNSPNANKDRTKGQSSYGKQVKETTQQDLMTISNNDGFNFEYNEKQTIGQNTTISPNKSFSQYPLVEHDQTQTSRVFLKPNFQQKLHLSKNGKIFRTRENTNASTDLGIYKVNAQNQEKSKQIFMKERDTRDIDGEIDINEDFDDDEIEDFEKGLKKIQRKSDKNKVEEQLRNQIVFSDIDTTDRGQKHLKNLSRQYKEHSLINLRDRQDEKNLNSQVQNKQFNLSTRNISFYGVRNSRSISENSNNQSNQQKLKELTLYSTDSRHSSINKYKRNPKIFDQEEQQNRAEISKNNQKRTQRRKDSKYIATLEQQQQLCSYNSLLNEKGEQDDNYKQNSDLRNYESKGGQDKDDSQEMRGVQETANFNSRKFQSRDPQTKQIVHNAIHIQDQEYQNRIDEEIYNNLTEQQYIDYHRGMYSEYQNQYFPKSFAEDQVDNQDSSQRLNNQNKQQYGYQKKYSEDHIVQKQEKNRQKKRHESKASDEEEIKNQKMEQALKNKTKLNDDDIETILMNLIRRQRFHYRMKDIAVYLLKCICMRRRSTLRKYPEYKRHFMFVKGEQKLTEELNVVTLLKSIRQVKLLSQALLSQRQNTILKFQRKNLIETDSSSEDSDNNKKFYTAKLMESNNPFIRLVIFGKLKKMITSYKNQPLQEIDKRLLRGLFLRNLRDFDDDEKEKYQNKSLLMRIKQALIVPSSANSMQTQNDYPAIEQNLDTAVYDQIREKEPTRSDFKRLEKNLQNQNSLKSDQLNSKLISKLNSNNGIYHEQLQNQKFPKNNPKQNSLMDYNIQNQRSVVPITQQFHFYQPSNINMQQYLATESIEGQTNSLQLIKNSLENDNEGMIFNLQPSPLNANKNYKNLEQQNQMNQTFDKISPSRENQQNLENSGSFGHQIQTVSVRPQPKKFMTRDESRGRDEGSQIRDINEIQDRRSNMNLFQHNQQVRVDKYSGQNQNNLFNDIKSDDEEAVAVQRYYDNLRKQQKSNRNKYKEQENRHQDIKQKTKVNILEEYYKQIISQKDNQADPDLQQIDFQQILQILEEEEKSPNSKGTFLRHRYSDNNMLSKALKLMEIKQIQDEEERSPSKRRDQIQKHQSNQQSNKSLANQESQDQRRNQDKSMKEQNYRDQKQSRSNSGMRDKIPKRYRDDDVVFR